MRFLTEQSIVLATVLALPVNAAPLPNLLTTVMGHMSTAASTAASGAVVAETIHSLHAQDSQSAGPPPPMLGFGTSNGGILSTRGT